MHALRRSLRWLVLFAALLLAFTRGATASEHPPLNLEIDVSGCTTASIFQVYFDIGDGILDLNSVAVPVAATPDRQRLIFPVPEGFIVQLRLDPLAASGTIIIDAAKLLTTDGREVGRLDLHTLTDASQIAQTVFNPETGALTVVTEPDVNDPQFFVPLNPPWQVDPSSLLDSFRRVAPDLLSFDLKLRAAGVLWLAGLVWLARRWFRARWPAWQLDAPASRPSFRWLTAWAAVPVILYAWLMLLNLGHTPLMPDSESSWCAVLTHALAHRWQYGSQVLLTYGPAMPLMLSAYLPSIDALTIAGQILCKGWFLVLLIWLGWRLTPVRRVVLWVAAVILFSGINAQALFSFSVMATGLLFARGGRAERWVIAPSFVYLATVTMIKVSFLLSTVVMLALVSMDLARQKRWRTAAALPIGFLVCFCLEWLLFGQHLGNLPLYLRGSMEMVSGFTQAMSVPPEPGVLLLALCMALAAAGQLALLWRPGQRPRWTDLPMLALLAAGLLLSWKASFVRADSHVLDWFAYALVSAAAAPAFVFSGRMTGLPRRWLEPICLGVIFLAGAAAIPRVSPVAAAGLGPMLSTRSLSTVYRLTHPQMAAMAETQSIEHSRATYDLPETKKAVGQGTVDMIGDEQAIALANGLNFRPRPSFVAYSTYTPWLMNLNVAYYCSPQAPDFVLFKLVSIDERTPTLQSGPLLIVLAQFYTPILTEGGYVLFQKREQPRLAAMPASFPLIKEGDFSIGDGIVVPPGPVWCQLEMRDTLWGKLLRLFYQQPGVQLRVDTADWVKKTRYVPAMGAGGFLLNPALTSADDFLHWMEGKPLTQTIAIRIVKSSAISASFQKRIHYKFYQVPTPPVPPPLPGEETEPAAPPSAPPDPPAEAPAARAE